MAEAGPRDQYRAELHCPQDIGGAQAAGFADGIDIDLHVATLNPTWPVIAKVYQEQAAAAGIPVNIVPVPSDGYWDEVWMQKDAVATRCNERPADQAQNEIDQSTAKWNDYKGTAFDALLSDARQKPDSDRRRALCVQAQEHLWETAGTPIPYHVTRPVGTTARVDNLGAVENNAVRCHLVTVDGRR